MQPRWLKPVDTIQSNYSSITFALSDPDGAITSTLLDNRAALFGKEVTVQKWIDKPVLIQCSRCHALGHNKASKVCTLGKDSVKCYFCGGAHKSERHDQHCARKHAVAGICDCKHFRCLNCHKPGHNCRDIRCPARDLYRPKNTRKAENGNRKGKGKAKATGSEMGRTPEAEFVLDVSPLTAGPSRLVPPVTEPSRPSPAPLTTIDLDRMEEYYNMEWERANHEEPDWCLRPLGEWDQLEQPTGWGSPAPPQHKEYSPSCPNGNGNANPLNSMNLA